jgi:hypothetical protein
LNAYAKQMVALAEENARIKERIQELEAKPEGK